MSVVIHKRGRSKRKYGRRPSRKRKEKALHRRRIRSRIYNSRGWKLVYSDYFEEINEYPYIVRKDN